MQRLRDERDEADQALTAVTDFSRRSWRPWADAVIRAATDPVTAAASALTRITREENAARETVKTLTKQKENLDRERKDEEEAQRIAIAERETLRNQDEYPHAVNAVANARQLGEQADRARTAAQRSEQRASKAQAAVVPGQQRLGGATQNLNSAERSVTTAADQVSGHAAGAGLSDVTAAHLPERDTARLRQAARQRTEAARRANELIDAHSKALGKAEDAASAAATARTRLNQAERTAAGREPAVEAAITATADTLAAWARDIDERIRPAAETVEKWASLVAGLAEAASPSPALALAITREYMIPARRPPEKRQSELEAAMARNVTERGKLNGELDRGETERDPVPGDPEFRERRRRPEGVTAEGAPFWRLVETLEDAPFAMIEAALDASGLLQAWVTSDGAYLASRDGDETVWAPGAGEALAMASLRDVLRPADDAGELAAAVNRMLTRVAYGTDVSAHAVAVSPDGRWRHGELTGTANPLPGSPKLLGAAARAADRIRRAEQIRSRISDLADDHELMSFEFEDIVGLLDALEDAGNRLPSDSDAVTALRGPTSRPATLRGTGPCPPPAGSAPQQHLTASGECARQDSA